MADLAKEPTWSETPRSTSGRHRKTPGTVNAAGQFSDPHGLELRLITRDVTGAVAQRLVDAGALVVVEECGCGAGPGGCTPWWLDDDQLRKLRGGAAPWVTGRNQAPTWIDQWGNDDHVVVFAHGEVCWGGVL